MKIGIGFFKIVLWGILSAGFFLGGPAYGAGSPLGTWDFTVTGAKLGSAYLTFGADWSIIGYILVIPAPGNKGGTDHIEEFGFAILAGGWQFDGNQVTGYLYSDPATTVRLDITSLLGTVADSVNNQTFTMTGTTEDGNVKLSGVPFTPSAAMPSTWITLKQTQGKAVYTEIYSAIPDSTLGGGNLYDLVGQGADICIIGRGALSRGNNFNIAIEEFAMPSNGDCSTIDNSTGGTGSAAIGQLNLQTYTATLTGVQAGSPGPKVVMPILCK